MKLQLSLAVCLAVAAMSLSAQFASSEWKTTIGTIEEKEHLGRKALFLNKGLAFLPVSNFSNGVIEADISTTVMGGIAFRIDDDYNCEEVYIRVPKSAHPDALQYTPVFNGEFSWQFFSEYQANVSWPAPNQWVHLKIIVENDKAGVYVMGQDTAVLLIDSLRTGNSSGRIGIWTLRGAYFSNLVYRDASTVKKLPSIKKKFFYNKDAVSEWMISEPDTYKETPPAKLLSSFASAQKWKVAKTEPDGYLNINKYAKKKTWGQTRDNSNDIVWLKYELNEPATGTKPFSFEYSNLCFVYINNQKIFAGNNSFLLKGALYRGDIDKKMRANTIFLPVRKGKNSLMIAVSGVANGWGFMGQFTDGSTLKFQSL